jgi:hypothetical protein
MQQKRPDRTGEGMLAKKAPSLPRVAKTSIRAAPVCRGWANDENQAM